MDKPRTRLNAQEIVGIVLMYFGLIPIFTSTIAAMSFLTVEIVTTHPVEHLSARIYCCLGLFIIGGVLFAIGCAAFSTTEETCNKTNVEILEQIRGINEQQ